MQERTKTLFFTISRGSLIRNFFHSGIVPRILDSGIRVVVLCPFYDHPEYLKEYAHPNLSLAPLLYPANSLRKRIIREFLQGAIFNRTINARFLHRITKEGEPSKLWYLPRVIFFASFRFVPGFKKFIRFVDLHLDPDAEHDYLFEKYHPDMVFSTAPSDYADIGVLKSAKRFGVPTISMPKSWDNLSKILFNVKTDQLIIWSQFMEEQAIKFQNYTKEELSITGAPQFDTYAHKELLLSREEFCKKNGLDPKKRIILYGSTGSNACYEAHYLELIKGYLENGKIKDTQVLIRPHTGYLHDKDQFEYLDSHPLFVLDRHDKQDPNFKDNWDTSKDHLTHLFNSLSHADVCINVGSTLTIDAVMCGTPVINIRFDADPNIDQKMSVKRLHKSDYIQAITKTVGSLIIDDEPSFLSGLQKILEGKYENTKGMEHLRTYLAYKNDGMAGERIGQTLLTAMQ